MPSRSRSNRPSVPQLITTGVYRERNNLIIDASCYPPVQPPKEADDEKEEGDNPKAEIREHAPHANGGPEGSSESK